MVAAVSVPPLKYRSARWDLRGGRLARAVSTATAEICESGGRITTRIIQVLPAPDDLPFPHVSQAYVIERHVPGLDGRLLSDVAAPGITSLTAARADPGGLPAARPQPVGYRVSALIDATAANNPCYARAMVWIIIIGLIIAFLAIYAAIVLFFFKKLLRPRQGTAARKMRRAAGTSGLRQRLSDHGLARARHAPTDSLRQGTLSKHRRMLVSWARIGHRA